MDESSFQATQASLSGELDDGIRDKFSIDWKQTQYQDLWKPLYSGIAARLKIAEYYGPGNIPQSVADQASYWARSYTTRSSTNAMEYRNATDVLMTSKQVVSFPGSDFSCSLLSSSFSINFQSNPCRTVTPQTPELFDRTHGIQESCDIAKMTAQCSHATYTWMP